MSGGHRILEETDENGMLQIETTCRVCGGVEITKTTPDAEIGVLAIVPALCKKHQGQKDC